MIILVFLAVVLIFASLGFFTVQFAFLTYHHIRHNLSLNRSALFGKALLYVASVLLAIFFSVQNLVLAINSIVQKGLFNDFGVPQLSIIGYILGMVVYIATKRYAQNKKKQS